MQYLYFAPIFHSTAEMRITGKNADIFCNPSSTGRPVEPINIHRKEKPFCTNKQEGLLILNFNINLSVRDAIPIFVVCN